MPVKKSKVKSQKSKVTSSSLRAKRSNLGRVESHVEIATDSSSLPQDGTIARNDKKGVSRVSLSVPLFSLAGRATGTLALPKEIFGQKINKELLSQAIRVYTTNRKALTGSTKTRGEVEGSTAKIYRQKGTGRARHGAVRAPIFVGGGIVFGPKPRKVRLSMPQKMKKAALFAALSSKAADKSVFGISGIDKASGKTKEMVKLIEQLGIKGALVVTDKKLDNVARAGRNIEGVSVLSVNQLNAYEVLCHQSLLISKEALEVFGKKEAVK